MNEYPKMYFWLHEEFRRRMEQAISMLVTCGSLSFEEANALRSIVATNHMADVMRRTDFIPLVESTIRNVVIDTLGWLTMSAAGSQKINPETGAFHCTECAKR